MRRFAVIRYVSRGTFEAETPPPLSRTRKLSNNLVFIVVQSLFLRVKLIASTGLASSSSQRKLAYFHVVSLLCAKKSITT